jgi:hypothetical protein
VFPGFLGENGLITSLENYPNGAYWEAKLLFYGLEYGEMKEGLFWGSGIPHKTGTKTYSFTCTASPSETIFL